MPLADLGYLYENSTMSCRVLYPKTVVYSNYYANFDEVGKILYDALEDDKEESFLEYGKEDVGYSNLRVANYFVKQLDDKITITNNGYELVLRENFNAVDVQENTYFSKLEGLR